jgi:HupE / UreJ protein
MNSSAAAQIIPSFRIVIAISTLFFLCFGVFAHPMPNSMVILDIKSDGVAASVQLPLNELALSFRQPLHEHPEKIIAQYGDSLKIYLLQHIHPISPDNRVWDVTVRNMFIQSVPQSASGAYHELIVQLWLQPPLGASSRVFSFQYDAIIHKVVTHNALVSIRQDWDKGLVDTELSTEIGTISLDIPTNTILPFNINLTEGSLWRGFKSMVALGMKHIKEGTDHLLFLLVFLLAAPLLVEKGRWQGFGGMKYSLIRLLKMITAFTVGHSITLLAGAVGWLRLPSQPIEICIAFSILVSAIHALRPIFFGKEMYISAGFGLIHGLAFANTLTDLELDVSRMMLSILGFNIGIELMQLAVVAITVPFLMLLSRTSIYKYVRVGGAVVAIIVAIAWMMERCLEKSNIITVFVENATSYAPYGLGMLAAVSIGHWLYEKFSIV